MINRDCIGLDRKGLLTERSTMEIVESVLELDILSEQLDKKEARLSRRLGEVEVAFRNVNELVGDLKNRVSEIEKWKHQQYTEGAIGNIIDKIERLEKHYLQKTCGTCKHRQSNGKCWRFRDGRTFEIVGRDEEACEKHEEEECRT